MFSVIVPAYNASATIKACLSLLSDQTIGAEKYEIILINDGSTDDTAEIAAGFASVKVLNQRNSGPAAARNTGAKEAKGDIVLFTDSDCSATRNWIEEMVKPFDLDAEIIGVKGEYKTKQREIVAKFVQLEYEDKYDVMRRHKYIDFIDTYSAAFKKDVFIEAGGYDSDFPVACAEDVELSYRLSEKGYKMVFNPQARVYHIHPSSLLDYFKKKYKFAFWRVLAVKKNHSKALKDSHTPQLMKLQAVMPPLIAGAVIYSFFSRSGLWLLIPLLTIYFMTMIPFVAKAVRKDPLIGLVSPLMLFLRSTAQSIGLISGVIRTKRVYTDAKKK